MDGGSGRWMAVERVRERSISMDRYTKQLEVVERETRDVLAKARGITSAAADEGRGITGDEDRDIQGFLKSVEVLKDKRSEIMDAISTRQRVEDAGKALVIGDGKDEAGTPVPAHRKAVTIGDAFVKSSGYKNLVDSGLAGSWSTGVIPIEGKATLSTTGIGADTEGGKLIQRDVQLGIIPKLFERLTVADLMAQGTTQSNLVRYMREILATNAAAGTAEGAQKPESSLEFDAVDEPVKKIALYEVALLAA